MDKILSPIEHLVGWIRTRVDGVFSPYHLHTYAIASLGVFLYVVLRLRRKRYNLAPGPFQIPIIGNAIQLACSKLYAEENFAQMSKKYGPVVRANILGLEFIVLNDLNVIREAFVTKPDDFANRPKIWTGDMMSDGGKDILWGQPSPVWKYQRQIVHQAIRKYASGVNIEQIVVGIFDHVDTLLEAEIGPLKIRPITQFIAYNLISTLTFGKQFSPDDDEFMKLKAMIKLNEDSMGQGNPVDFMPSLVYCPLLWSKLNKIKSTMDFFKKFIHDQLKESKQDNSIENLSGYIMAQQAEAGQEDSSKKNIISEVYLVNTTLDVFLAGIDTTNTTLEWFIGFMAKYPKVQKRLQKIIDETYSPGVSLTDVRHKMPYVEAVLNEVMRIETVAPMGIPVITGCDTSIGGYDVPKGCTVVTNIWAIHNSPEYWDQPEIFNPDRFLNDDGSLKRRVQAFLPFGNGRRACIGELIAKSSLFMMVVLLFHKYEFSIPPDDPDWKLLRVKVVIAIQPNLYKVVVKNRNQ